MDVVRAIRNEGGVADSATLIDRIGRKEFRRAVRTGTIVLAGPNRYVLPGGKERLAAAARVGGAVSHLSAAQHWGWRIKTEPRFVQVVVPRGRKLSDQRTSGLEVFRGPVDGLVTGKVRTVVDCCRQLPFDEALAVVDSALRDPDVTLPELLEAARASSRNGRTRALRVLQHADAGADNAFESVLRALCIQVGLVVEAQVQIGDIGFCDIADRSRMIAIEGESFRYHGSQPAFEKDVRRYTGFGRLGWLVLRFTVDDVLGDPPYVLRVLRDVMTVRPIVSAPQLTKASA